MMTYLGRKINYTAIIGVLLLASFTSCKKNKPNLFVLKNDSGIEFNNQLSPNADLNILTYLYYYNGGGVASGDFNNDGLIDLYFTGNQVADRLYLNLGNLKFKDITSVSGIDNKTGWTTGVTVVDINNDGLLDIYVCQVGQFKTISGQNLLFVNQGVNESGIPTFKEEASKYQLDIISFATQSAFFDYDLDGDLDMYLLNHSVNPNRTYGKGMSRQLVDTLAGDKLFENQEGLFIEVSEDSGVFQGKIGYGLGLGVSDLNHDGYPDLYIGNDFFENDYLYINQKDGTFKEIISDNENSVGHTSHFSMGNDIADIDNDGWTDIVSLDMLPQNLQAYKTSGREYNNSVYDQYLKNGYRPQYMQNMLLHNKNGNFFQETAFASGISATDWSWSPLIVDLDNDGHKDLFVSNGILGATNDMDFINFIANKKIQDQLNKGMEEKDLKFTEQLPQRKLSNYFFRNNGDLSFTDNSANWFQHLPSFSNGSTYADLDNDGDLDLVVNNVNAKAFLLENKTESSANKFIKIKFKGSEKNTMGIGSKIKVFTDTLSIYLENYSTRGYLSAVAPEMTVGIGPRDKVDSLIVIWPDGKSQKLVAIKSGTTQILDYKMASSETLMKKSPKTELLSSSPISLSYSHRELPSYEFGREPLIPYSKGDEGPKVSVGDVNGDGLDDIYIGGGKKQLGALYLQTENNTFAITQQPDFELVKNNEETDNLFFDADNDGDLDLIVVSGGNEYPQGPELQPVLYLNNEMKFEISTSFPNIELNASVVKAADLDADGDQDLIIGANASPRKFGRSAKNHILYNDGAGNFEELSAARAASFSDTGLIEDIQIIDLNNDDLPDIIAVGHWMPITIFMNSDQGFHLMPNSSLAKTNGLWNHIRVADFDKDGDQDFIVGNWGRNTRLQASIDHPMQLYIADFDLNGKEETILTSFQQGQETVFSSKDELSKQIPSINKKFLSYKDFANAEFNNLFDKKTIQRATLKKVYELSSCYFENIGNGEFQKHTLPFHAQLSSIKTIYLEDYNHDGFIDVLAAGNDYGISTQLSRLDASHGVLLINDKNGFFTIDTESSLNIPGKSRDIAEISIQEEKYLIITLNDASPLFLKMKK